MLKSEAIVVSTRNHKPEKFDEIANFVRFYVRHCEYVKVTQGTDWKKFCEDLSSAVPDCDPLSLDKATVEEKLSAVDAEDFLAQRNEVIALKSAIAETGATIDQFNALSETDRVFVILQCHTAMPSIKLSSDILDKIDMAKPVEKYFKQGSLKGIKDIFRSIFANTVGQEGELFYGVKLRKSDFADNDLRNCLSYFRGNARRSVTKKGDTSTYGKYEWVCKETNKNAQAMALTNLFAVVLDRDKEYEVIKPEEAE